MLHGKTWNVLGLVSLLGLSSACRHEAAEVAVHHEHKAPHGGTLVELGDELAHVELVFDPSRNSFRAYVLDGEAENALRPDQAEIELKLTPRDKPADGTRAPTMVLKLKAVANVLTGETETHSSELEGRSELLQGLSRFDAELVALSVKGQEFRDVAFLFPEGNEPEE